MKHRILPIALTLVYLAGCAPDQASDTAAQPESPAAVEAPAADAGSRYDQTLRWAGENFDSGIAFRVVADDGTLTVTPSGLEADNRPFTTGIEEGTVAGAEVADLDADGSPEIYVYVAAPGGAGQELVAFAVNKGKSMSMIYLPPVTDSEEARDGYRGHDEFAAVEQTFVRRFPVYREGDPDDAPSGGMRQVQYELAPGEAGWVLRPTLVLDY